MGIGLSIFLLALGAVLTFAADWHLAGLDLDVVGIILMVVGAIGVVLALLVWGPRRTARRGGVVEERRVYDEPPL